MEIKVKCTQISCQLDNWASDKNSNSNKLEKKKNKHTKANCPSLAKLETKLWKWNNIIAIYTIISTTLSYQIVNSQEKMFIFKCLC